MNHGIVYSRRADSDIREAMTWWREHRSAKQAARWYSEIYAAIATLRENPDRLPLVTESQLHPLGFRQLLFGIGGSITHRVIFNIEDEKVVILSVRHVARRPVGADDLT